MFDDYTTRNLYRLSRGARSWNRPDFIIQNTPSSADQTRENLNENTMPRRQRYLKNNALKIHQNSVQNTSVYPEHTQVDK